MKIFYFFVIIFLKVSETMKNKNIFVIIFYFIYSFIPQVFVLLLNINLDSNLSKNIYLIISYLIYLIFITFLFKDELKNDLKNFKFKSILKYIPIYILGIFLMIILNYLMSKITNIAISKNETDIRNYIKVFPIPMAFSTVIYAPIVEELTFRKAFMNIFNKTYLFVLVSGTVFGLIHISSFSLDNFLMTIPYIIIGINFSYIYYKSNNIFTTITLHSIHNLILLTIQFIGG